MEFKLIIDKERQEQVIVYAHERSSIVNEIEALVAEKQSEIFGYSGCEAVKLSLSEVYCFTIEKGKLYAITEKEKLLLMQRLYKIEELLGKDFIKINQSSIVNMKKIDRFDASFGGALIVKLKNG